MPFKTSKLSASFSDMLKDTSSLSMLDYFIQFLETLHVVHLMQFYLSVESFRSTVSSREQHHSKKRSQSSERRKRHDLSRTSSIISNGSDIAIRVGHEVARDAEERMNHSQHKSPIVGGNVGGVSDATRGSPGGVPQSRGRVEEGLQGGNGEGGGKGTGGSSGEDVHNKMSPSVELNKRLLKRETENHMYCNCKVHMVTTPPGTPEYPRVISGRPASWQGSPSVTVKCEHGSPDTMSRVTLDGNPVDGLDTSDKISNQS